ncbi:MAG: TlpA disulfide reductase family protein [Anaerolineales bacterium]|jgi:peroxiredoxin
MKIQADDLTAWIGDRKRWSLLMVGVFVLCATWIGLSSLTSVDERSADRAVPRQGFAAPDFTLEALHGGEITLSDLRGKAVILNLWASWCLPCRAEMPAIQRVYEKHRDRGLEILAIHATYQDTRASAQAFIDEHDLTFPILLDTTGEVASLYHLRALPTTFFIDRQGIIQQVIVGGPMSEATLHVAVDILLDEVP